MSRLANVSLAAALMVLLGPAFLTIWAASASKNNRVQRYLRRSGLDNIPLLLRVLQGRLTIGEWFRVVFR